MARDTTRVKRAQDARPKAEGRWSAIERRLQNSTSHVVGTQSFLETVVGERRRLRLSSSGGGQIGTRLASDEVDDVAEREVDVEWM